MMSSRWRSAAAGEGLSPCLVKRGLLALLPVGRVDDKILRVCVRRTQLVERGLVA
jgi:hypothetical protein